MADAWQTSRSLQLAFPEFGLVLNPSAMLGLGWQNPVGVPEVWDEPVLACVIAQEDVGGDSRKLKSGRVLDANAATVDATCRAGVP